VAGCCECGDEPSGSCTMELVNWKDHIFPCILNVFEKLEFYVM
jgi:hypothetical protein